MAASDGPTGKTIAETLKARLAEVLPSKLESDAAHLVDQAARYDNGRMSNEELLALLVADPRIAHLLAELQQMQQQLAAHTGSVGDAIAGDKVGADKVGGDKVGGDVINGNRIDITIEGVTDPNALIQIIRKAGRPEPGEQHDALIDAYQQQFVGALGQLTAAKYVFPLTVRQSATHNEGAAPPGIPLEQLIARIQTSRMIILRGAAGSGKSTCMRRLANILVQDEYSNIVPIFLQLRELNAEMLLRAGEAIAEDAEPEQYIEPLLGASIVPLSPADLKKLGDHAMDLRSGMILVMADGLNELYGEDLTNLILKRLTSYVTRRGLSARVLVSDRITPRDVINQQWQQMRLEQLAPQVVFQQLQGYGIDATYTQLSENDKRLLQTPYFLAYALDHNTTTLVSAAEALKSFFEELGFDVDTLDLLAHAAFTAYQDHHSYKFKTGRFTGIVGEKVFQKLIDEGVVELMPDGSEKRADDASREREVRFDHPLKHDYLVARYLAQHTTEWTPATLDVVSFESNSFDALAMTLELLQDEAQCDTFIQRVHNWNWAAALTCIAKAVRSGGGRHSQEIQFAVMALVAEKLFDAVRQTRVRAKEVLALFPQTMAAPYTQAGSIDELRVLVQKQVQAEAKFLTREAWFPEWHEIFLRFDKLAVSEHDLRQIVRQEAVLGWTAANVLRRYRLSDMDVRQLRAYYDACAACQYSDWRASTIRSRVVHALGRTDTRMAVDFLFEALTNERYAWAQIGAARSLVEIAALTADSELRGYVIARLLRMVNDASSEIMGAKILHEIGQSAFYDKAQAGWHEAVSSLIVLVRDRQTDSERDWWSHLIVEFETFCKPLEQALGAD